MSTELMEETLQETASEFDPYFMAKIQQRIDYVFENGGDIFLFDNHPGRTGAYLDKDGERRWSEPSVLWRTGLEALRINKISTTPFLPPQAFQNSKTVKSEYALAATIYSSERPGISYYKTDEVLNFGGSNHQIESYSAVGVASVVKKSENSTK